MKDNKKSQENAPKDILNLNYLPKQPQARQQLCNAIKNNIKRLQKQLKNDEQSQQSQKIMQKLNKLSLRLKLIQGCAEMSLLRLDHLEQIFKHYCTHIFKTGKHMTFDRLQYQKVHLTMDRFFLFLKDFQLNSMRNSKKQEVIDKNNIIMIFKKVSSNCRELSFQEFIQCLQKVAVLYYDEKQVFYEKKEQERLQKQKRKQEYEKKRKARLRRRKQDDEKQVNQNKQDQGQGEQQNEQNKQQKYQQEDNNNQKQEGGEQNDDLVNDLINDKDLEDPNEEINKITNRYAFEEQNEDGDQQSKTMNAKQQTNKPSKYDSLSDDMLLVLTNEEKIQFYYQIMINVDSVSDYRKKLTELNLPIFQKKGNKRQAKTSNNSQSKLKKHSIDEHARLQQLKKRMEEKKVRQKASPIPKHKDDGAWQKAEEEKKKKRELKKQREQLAKKKNKEESDALIQKKIDSQKSVKDKAKQQKYNQNQVDWQMIGKISIDQLKLKQFNPNRYFSKDDDDKIFLEQYQGGRPRIMSGLQMRERNSIIVAQGAKKRANQVENRQKKQQKQLDNLSKRIGQHVPVKSRFS